MGDELEKYKTGIWPHLAHLDGTITDDLNPENEDIFLVQIAPFEAEINLKSKLFSREQLETEEASLKANPEKQAWADNLHDRAMNGSYILPEEYAPFVEKRASFPEEYGL